MKKLQIAEGTSHAPDKAESDGRMEGIRPRRFICGFFAMGFLFWLCLYVADAASSRVYYDSAGDIISEEEYLKLTGQAQPAASPETVKSPGTETVPPEEKSAPETPPAENEPRTPPDVRKSGEIPPATENEPGKPVLPSDQPVSARSLTFRRPAPAETKGGPLYEATITSDTLFRAFQRDTDKKPDATVSPLYEYLQIDLDTPEKGFSLHTFGWGRYDFNDTKFYRDNPDGELLYGYLEYNRSDYGLNLKLGRQHIFDGIINSSIDGLGIKSSLTPYLSLSFYGGSPVALSSDNGRAGDSFWGGRIAAHLGSRYELGLSYMLENSDGVKDGEKVGVDLYLMLPGDIYLRGQSAYNLDTRGWGEHFVEAGLDVGDFHLRPVFERYQFIDYFNKKDNSADPFRFLADTDEILTVLGGDVLWRRFGQVDLGAKILHYSYDQRDDDAMYYEGNLAWYVNGHTRIGGQIGRMDGGTSETAYFLTRGFFHWDRPLDFIPLGFITGDIVNVHYDADIFGKDNALSVSLGTGVKFFNDSLEMKLSADYSSDPYFDSDLRGMLTIRYQKSMQTGAGRDRQRRPRP